MFETYNNQTNTYNRYIHIPEMEDELEKLEKISNRIHYKNFDDLPEGKQLDDLNVTIDDAKSLEKLFADNPFFKLEEPLDIMRRTLFLYACGLSGDLEGIEYLVRRGAEINRCDLSGENALMYVIQNLNMPTEMKLKAVQLLIDKGIDINWNNIRFETPLMMALNCMEIEVANLLADNGGYILRPPARETNKKENKEGDKEEKN